MLIKFLNKALETKGLAPSKLALYFTVKTQEIGMILKTSYIIYYSLSHFFRNFSKTVRSKAYKFTLVR